MRNFAFRVEQWYNSYGRELPWRQTHNPYHIWLSEIILQQTRVEQGRDYYHRFLDAFPDVHSLAAAPEADVMRLWQGLGYYSRARNLHAAAKQVDAMGIDFPTDYLAIRALPGVGDYTAAAIASAAYNLPYAVLDGNVYRVLSRYFGISTPIDSTAGKKEFSALAQELLDNKNPALYNQAIMDFGALHCKPRHPKCDVCPLLDSCQAYSFGMIDSLPVKSKKVAVKDRYFTYFYLHTRDGKLMIRRREGRDIWHGLYEFPLVESSCPLSVCQVREHFPKGELNLITSQYIHQLTHQRLHVDFYELLIDEADESIAGVWIDQDDLQRYALPQLLVVLL